MVKQPISEQQSDFDAIAEDKEEEGSTVSVLSYPKNHIFVSFKTKSSAKANQN